ncbi:MAG: sodium:proton antiporter [Planctomycetota bacterium]
MDFLLYLALIPALGLTAQWLAWRTSLPSILLLLLFGVLLGSFIRPDDLLAEITGGDATAGAEIMFPLVSLAVAVIMFEGGLTLQLRELREAGTAALRLCTLGAVITFVGASFAARWTLGFDWILCFLLGGVLVVTGPTVIGPLLRQVRPSKRVAATLKWEGIVIDPIGAVLAVLVFELLVLHPGDASVGAAIWLLIKTAAVGGILGVAGGAGLTFLYRNFLVPDHLQGVFALSAGLLLFAVSNFLAHESGLITVTVLGIWLTNQKGFDIEHIIEFKENLRTLLIGCLFIVLGSRVEASDITAIGWPGIGFLAMLIVFVRPVSALVSLMGTPLEMRERLFVAGLAPRGIVAAAVSSVFALEIERNADGLMLEGSDQLATVTFFVIVGTVAVYGLSALPLAKWLGLSDERTNGLLIAGADAWVRDFAKVLKKTGIPVLLVDSNFNKISKARIDGIDCVCANILNEHALEELPMAGIGRMLAMTPNDEVNSLAVRECRTIFDRANLYQLTFNFSNQHGRRGLTKNLMGRELFGEGKTFTVLRDLHEAGATFKSTTLTEEFTYDDYTQHYGDGSTLLCVVKEDKSLSVTTVKDPVLPLPGQTIIALVTSVPAELSTD